MDNRIFLRSRHKELLGLLDKSGPALYALMTKLTLRPDVAEELMQELFIKLNNARDGETVENWDAYARRAAINLVFDWRRKQKRRLLSLKEIGQRVSNGDSPLGNLIRVEELEETLNAIGRLKGVTREALVMRYIQQQSYDHIADQLHKTTHQVRALCSKALKHLRNTLTPGRPQSSDKEPCDVEN